MMSKVEFYEGENGWYWTCGNFFDGPFDTQQDAFQAFVECEFNEMTEVSQEVIDSAKMIRGNDE
jgi:hypothetical protein